VILRSYTVFNCDLCDVCGVYIDIDAVRTDRQEWFKCSRGHLFCRNHISLVLPTMSLQDLEPMIDEMMTIYKHLTVLRLPHCHKEFRELRRRNTPVEIIDVLIDLYERHDRYNSFYLKLQDMLCPICSFKAVSDDDLLNYLLKEKGVLKEKVKNDILLHKFNSYQEFLDYKSFMDHYTIRKL